MDELKQNPAPTPISEIKPKTRFEGTVAKIELFGALVDIGAERPGLLHISQMRSGDQGHVNRVADVLSVGSRVTVWAREIEPDKALISLTMTEPALYDWGDLKKNQQVAGKVTRVTDFGAFVDFKGPREGLIPAGQLSRQRIAKPSDVISEGDEVTPWVVSVERKRERIGLSLVEPPALPWPEVKKGHTYRGKITRLERFGAFVDIGAERDGLIHVSELASSFVKDPSEVVAVGEEVEVKVLDVNPRKRQIQLSMKGINLQEADPEIEDEALPTSMEQAFQSARRQSTARGGGRSRRGGDKQDRQRREQIGIMQRTLEQHQSRQ